MPKISRNTLVLLIFYCVFAGGFLYWVERKLEFGIEALGIDTAELVADQLRAIMHRDVHDITDGLSWGKLKSLRESITEATEQSSVLSNIEVVNAEGEVLASDDKITEKKRLPRPSDLFSDSQRAIVEVLPTERASERRFEIKVPIKKEDNYVAYIQLMMEYKPIGELYDQMYSYFLVASLAGLLLIIGIGLVIEFQFTKFAKMLAKIIEDSTDGDSDCGDVSGAYGVSGLEVAAKHLGDKIKDVRSEVDLKKYELDKITKILQVGVVLQDEHQSIDFASETAIDLVSGAVDQFDTMFSEVSAAIHEEVAQLPEDRSHYHLVLDRGDTERKIHVDIYPLQSHGWRGFLILLKDATAISALDEDLRAAAQARNLSRLYIGAVHDLKSPLGNIAMGLQALDNDLANDTSANTRLHTKKVIANMDAEVHRLNRLLTVLLDQAVPSSEEPESINVSEMVDGLIALTSIQAKMQRIEVEVHELEKPLVIRGLRAQLQQALLNIIINAFDAMKKGGALSISIGNKGNMVEISVCDSGGGIPSSLLPNIFDMHFTTRSSGTGIGLYVARIVVNQHHGEIRVNSTLGEGSCFHVSLPAEKCAL